MFRGYDAERERLVAIKLFTIELAPERVQRLVSGFEALVASNLTHPAIAAPLATGTRTGSAYLAHEFVAGESLDLAIREYGPAPPSDAVRVAAQLAGALDFAAAAGVHHGSLHPRDVLLSADDTRMTGLGIAHALEQIGAAAPVRRPYSAPERIAGAEWDRRADIFSLAALIYELMTGRRVSGTGTHASLPLEAIPTADAEALLRVFARALADDPGDRYETALAFVDALKGAFAQQAAKEPTPETLPSPGAVEPGIPLHREVADIQLKAPVVPSQLVEAEQARYRDVEVAPAIAPTRARDRIEPLSTALVEEPERSRSAVWPLAAALGIGIALGFAGGYATGMRDRSETTAPAGREFTESAVPEVKPEVGSARPEPINSAVQPKPTDTAAKSDAEIRLKPDATTARTTGSARTTNPGPAGAPATNPRTHGSAIDAPSTAPGRLLVRSTPAGARVTVDGRDAGVTPAVVHDLAVGSHQVRVIEDGYIAEERRIVITPRRPAVSLTVPLSSAAATNGRFVGDLTVQSRPTGAKVFLDGKLIGTTPLQIPAVRAGEHAIRLEYDGYRRWSSAVRIVANEATRVTASLER